MSKKKMFISSVSRKYGLGYVLLALVGIVLLFISIVSNHYVREKEKRLLEGLLNLNQLYVEVESANNYVNSAYIYLRDVSCWDYWEERKVIDAVIGQLEQDMRTDYSREVVDTVCTVKTYVQEADALLKMLEEHIDRFHENSMASRKIEEQYMKVQDILGYSNSSFQSAYSAKMVQARSQQQKLENLQKKIVGFQLLLFITGVFFCFLYCSRIIKGIGHSIITLSDGVQKIEKDVYAPILIEMNSGDEFDDFAGIVNHMIGVIQLQMRQIEENSNIKERLSQMEIENLRIYSELQENQLRLLQSRINPHFLFNTLNMISSLARMEDAGRTAEIIEITAEYLRYNLDNLSKSVTLKKEIHNLENYIYIQKCRFENRYEYELDVDWDCSDFLMPPMILQPLVENAIKHGLCMVLSGGKITVLVKKCENAFLLSVSDNGSGMSKEKISELYRSIREKKTQSTHVGLRNIYMRLQYFYKTDVEFLIDSSREKTQISIRLPIVR